jgi:hypothetical protein
VCVCVINKCKEIIHKLGLELRDHTLKNLIT